VAFFADAKNGEFGADYAIFQPEFRHSATGGGRQAMFLTTKGTKKHKLFLELG